LGISLIAKKTDAKMKVGLSSYREVCGVAATTIAEELALSFEEKVARLDEVLQTFSDEEMQSPRPFVRAATGVPQTPPTR